MLRVALTALFIVLANASAAADNERIFPADTDGTITFTMPSGNVGCTYVPAGGTPVYDTATGDAELHCTRVEPRYLVVIMDARLGGAEPIVSGEVPGLSISPILPYGAFWRAGPFTCLAALNGLTCTNASGAGLRMSRAEVITW